MDWDGISWTRRCKIRHGVGHYIVLFLRICKKNYSQKQLSLVQSSGLFEISLIKSKIDIKILPLTIKKYNIFYCLFKHLIIFVNEKHLYSFNIYVPSSMQCLYNLDRKINLLRIYCNF